ncbi:MAG: response regulator [Deltaproteobacteria bacterium]|nr:response regulator [Deltaproteobacteria bacterium]
MKRFAFGSLRIRLIFLVLFAVLPALGLMLDLGMEQRSPSISLAQERALELARSISDVQRRLIADTRQILFTLSQLPEVRQHNPVACSAVCANLLKESEGYTGFAVAKPDGDVFASAPPLAQPVNLADRPWFQRLVQSRGFVVGEYQKGRISDKATIVLTHPVLDDTGRLKAIVGAGLDLNWLSRFIAESSLPADTKFTIVDRNGTILVRYPDQKEFVGRSMPETSLVKAVLAEGEGVMEAPGLDGIPCFYGFTSLAFGSGSVHVVVGFPEQLAFAEGQQELIFNLALLGTVALLALVAAWFGGDLFIVRQVSALLVAAKGLADGNLTVRTGVSYGRGELGQLARAFDQIAESLEFHKAERRKSEEIYRSVVDNITMGVSLISIKMEILAINNQMRQWYPGLDPTTRPLCYQAYNDPLREGVCSYCPTAQTIRDGLVHEAITETPRGNQIMRYKIISSPIKDQAGNVLAAIEVVEDVTERMLAQEEKVKLETQLRQAQKMEAIGTLAGGIAHDFNNILGIISGYTDLTMLDMLEGSREMEQLECIRKAVYRAKELVQQILTFSRQREEELIPLRVSSLVKEALKMLRATLPSIIDIRWNIQASESEDLILGYPSQIHQVLMNLCTNASHAIGDQAGIIDVNLSRIQWEQEDSARPLELNQGYYLELTVSDTGCGIDPKIMDRIFEPYFTTKEAGVGTGMGLAVVHGIVKNHGGAITVESEPGKGSSFHVFFPALKDKGKHDGEMPLEPIPTGKECILLVDDEAALGQVAEKMLKHLGYEVVNRTSSIEALEAFRANPGKFDLVLTDRTMPQMTGMVLAREILKIRPDIPIILCTGFSDTLTQGKAAASGIREIVLKPFLLNDMARAVRHVLDQCKKTKSTL